MRFYGGLVGYFNYLVWYIVLVLWLLCCEGINSLLNLLRLLVDGVSIKVFLDYLGYYLILING